MTRASRLEFRVDDMSCQHCVDAITRTVLRADPQAVVEVDLGAHAVKVQSVRDVEDISAAIASAGYTPLPA